MGNETSKTGSPTRSSRSSKTLDRHDASACKKKLESTNVSGSLSHAQNVTSSRKVAASCERDTNGYSHDASTRKDCKLSAASVASDFTAARLDARDAEEIAVHNRSASIPVCTTGAGNAAVAAAGAGSRSMSSESYGHPYPPRVPPYHSFASSSKPKQHPMSVPLSFHSNNNHNSSSSVDNNNHVSHTNGSCYSIYSTDQNAHAVRPGLLALSRTVYHDASGGDDGGAMFSSNRAEVSVASVPRYIRPGSLVYTPVVVNHTASSISSLCASFPPRAVALTPISLPAGMSRTSSPSFQGVGGRHTAAQATPQHSFIDASWHTKSKHATNCQPGGGECRVAGAPHATVCCVSDRPNPLSTPNAAPETCRCDVASPAHATKPAAPHSLTLYGSDATAEQPVLPGRCSCLAATATATAAISMAPARVALPQLHVVPKYSLADSFAGEACGSSLVLRSYRQTSLSCAESHPNSSFAGVGSHAMASSPTHRGFPFGSSVRLHAEETVGTGVVTAAKPERHTRYQEITGYPLGMENYGNTCYSNSVIQLLYHCTPLRLRLLELQEVYEGKKGGAGLEENTVLHQLCKLVALMHKSNNCSREGQRQYIAPIDFLRCVRARNADFAQPVQHDAHEFAMFILNDIMETEKRIMADPKNRALLCNTKHKSGVSALAFWRHGRSKTNQPFSDAAAAAQAGGLRIGNGNAATTTNNTKSINSGSEYHSSHGSAALAQSSGSLFAFGMSMCDTHALADRRAAGRRDGNTLASSSAYAAVEAMTPLQAIVKGVFGSLTACLECGKVTARDEVFLDVSLETAQGSSLLKRLHHFGDPELLYGNNKLYCEGCARSVDAAKTIHIKHLPQHVLLVHLKRFQYDPQTSEFEKTSDHVALPMEMDVEEYLAEPSEDARSPGSTPDGGAGGEGHQDTKEGMQALFAEKGNGTADSGEAGHGAGGSSSASTPTIPESIQQKLRGVAHHKARFSLIGFAVHSGKGANSGHYFTCIRYGPNLWRRFDDELVSTMTQREVQQYFGVPINIKDASTTTAYLLLYERNA